MSDMMRLSNISTYISDDGLKSSWVEDHVLSSETINSRICNVNVLHDVIVSDHRPLTFCFACNLDTTVADYSEGTSVPSVLPQWHLCSDAVLQHFQQTVDRLLVNVHTPFSLLSCDDTVEQLAALARFDNDIISCLRKACELCIPHKRSITNQFNVPGWNTFVKEKHNDAMGRLIYFGLKMVNPVSAYCLMICENLGQNLS